MFVHNMPMKKEQNMEIEREREMRLLAQIEAAFALEKILEKGK